MLKEITDSIKEIENWIIDKRRQLHKYPEKSACEVKTKEVLKSTLEDLGIEVVEGYYTTGLTAVIRGKLSGSKDKTIGLRFDMDALEMEEKTELDFKSQNPGLMHACGHDGHMAMGLGCAVVLNKFRDKFAGNIKLIFQPAEEDALNGGGARYMIEDGVLHDEPGVDAMVGVHIWPTLNVGTAGTRVGPIMAASDPFKIRVKGKGVHASLPHMGTDPILIASQIVTNLQSIVSRNIDPFEQAVVSTGTIQGGTAHNTIPDEVEIMGTVRTFDDNIRQVVKEKMQEIVTKTAESLGGQGELEYTFGYPPTVNNEKMVCVAQKAIKAVLGDENYIPVQRPAPGGEDFAYFAREVPSAFIWLGYNQENEQIFPPHNPYYNFNEGILIWGTEIYCNIALEWLRNN
ncbi:M20 metallopeptidase family protein [Natranaerobius thermophilus]|uniref:Amidohydrolase n=1 Tax=Natranaerobius thermophilus (strain ATCC BAA-1301 / DSM 18059 / JW/NM-WN-LF) TaxID=457570 RepID=B2A6S7_NATTJ|nr:M20 family metallopeptidase [Natranaerobius thermophilus]ACB84208.1 amidohydrolase [Natranaerobius thermophilus JW/NM-WN-LF]